MPSPLLNRPGLLPDESLPSWLWRLQRANYYESPRTIEQIGAAYTSEADTIFRPSSGQTFSLLTQLTQVNPLEIYHASVHHFASVITPPDQQGDTLSLSDNDQLLLDRDHQRRHLWPANAVQYCPLCLAQAAYHRIGWTPTATAVCLHHHCLLVRHCPICRHNNRLSIDDLHQRRCSRCAFDLTQAPVVSVSGDTWGLFTQAVIQSWWSRHSPPVSHDYQVVNQPAPVLFCLLYGLSRAVVAMKHPLSMPSPSVLATQPITANKPWLHPGHTYAIFATAFEGMVNWPDGFHKLLDRVRSDSDEGQLRQVFGTLYTSWLEKQWRHASFQFVQDAFDNYLCRRYPLSPATFRCRRFCHNPAFKALLPYITEAEAASKLGVSLVAVQQLVRDKTLTNYSPAQPNAAFPSLNLVKRSDVVALRRQWREGCALSTTAKKLGVSPAVVLDLVQLQLLEAVQMPHREANPTWRLSCASVDDFKRRLRRRTTRQPFSYLVRLPKAVKALSPFGYNTAHILHWVIDGKLTAFWVTQRLRDMAISGHDLEKLLEDLRVSCVQTAFT